MKARQRSGDRVQAHYSTAGKEKIFLFKTKVVLNQRKTWIARRPGSLFP